MEITLFNSAISGMSISGNRFFYQNPLESKDGAERSNWIGLTCCFTNMARFTPQVGNLFYARKNNKILVNLYGSGTGVIQLGENNKVSIQQETSFPWEGIVNLNLTLDQPTEFEVCLRIPSWVSGKPIPSDLYKFSGAGLPLATVVVNGELIETNQDKKGYVSIRRTWNTGDVIVLNLPMLVNRVYAHDNLEENKGKVSLMYGPFVYCFEGVDNPDVDLFNVSIPKDVDMITEHRPNLLGGVTLIKTTGMDADGKPVPLIAIPYYAWANREKSPMNIWLHEKKN
jgi:DUF1680 family protein